MINNQIAEERTYNGESYDQYDYPREQENHTPSVNQENLGSGEVKPKERLQLIIRLKKH